MKSLQKLSYKTLFTILFLSLAGIVFFSKISKPAKKISAAWWNDSWHYRQFFPISNTSGSNQNDMVIKINLNTSLLISSGKTQSSCNDIRLTDVTGNVLQHFVTQCNTQITNVYVKIPTIPSSGSGVYLYYGNSTATNIETSDIFTYFDGFESATPKDIWTTTQLSVNIASDFSNKGNRAIKFIAQGASSDILYQTFSSSNNWTNHYLEYEFYADQAAGASWRTDPRNSSNSRMNAWKSFSITAATWDTFSEDLNTNTYKEDIKSIMYFTSGDDINRNIYIDNFRIRHCLSTITVGTTQPEESGGGPIAYWKFNEGVNTTVYDSGSGQKNGYFLDNPVWKNEDECISGKCLALDGIDDAINIVNENFTSLTDYTMSAWINIKGNHKNYDGVIISSGNWNSDHWSFGIDSSNTAFKLRKWDGTNSSSKNYQFQLNKWTHISIVRSGSTLTYYVDGNPIGSISGNLGNLVSNYTNTTIGRETYYNGYFSFNGWIDEIKIFPYARTDNQIKQDYNSRGSLSSSSVNLGIKSSTIPSLNSSLISYWKLDEGGNTTIYDSSGNNNTGTLGINNNSPTWSNDSKFNKSLSFDGDDYVVTNFYPGTSTLGQKFTWSFWIKYNYFSANTGSLGNNGDSPRFYTQIENANGGIRIALGDSYWTATTLGTENIGQWLYITFTYDSGTVKTYVNGILKNTNSGINFSGDSPSPFSLGRGYGNTRFLSGYLDEIKIYNRALTAEEIKQDYNAGSAVQLGSTTQNISGTTTSLEYCIPGDTSYCPPPIVEWNFEENTGVIAKDNSGNNNNGIFGTGNSAPTWTIGANNKGAGVNFINNASYIDNTSLVYGDNYTVEAWIKPTDLSIIEDYGRTIMASSPSANTYFPFWLLVRGNKIRAYAYSSSPSAYYIDSNFNDIQVNNWYHVALSATKNGQANLYINGILDSTFASGNRNSNQKLTIADLRAGRDISFKGSIDQVKIYDYVRTPAQITYDYNKGAPIGHWKLNECQGDIAYDSSGNNNHGTINIGANGTQNSLGTCAIGTSAAWTNGVSGKINSSLNFDGNDDYINIGRKSILNLIPGTDSFSVSGWFKTTNKGVIYSFGGSTTIRQIQIDITDSGTVEFYAGQSTGGQLSYSGGYNDGKWHNVTGTATTTTMYLYIDGSLKKTQPVGTGTNAIYGAEIGSRTGGTGYLMDGQIDDVRIYNYALTPEQIKTVYNNGAVNFQ